MSNQAKMVLDTLRKRGSVHSDDGVAVSAAIAEIREEFGEWVVEYANGWWFWRGRLVA